MWKALHEYETFTDVLNVSDVACEHYCKTYWERVKGYKSGQATNENQPCDSTKLSTSS